MNKKDPHCVTRQMLAYTILVSASLCLSMVAVAVFRDPTVVTSGLFLVVLVAVGGMLDMSRQVLAYYARWDYVGCPFARVFRFVNILPLLSLVVFVVRCIRMILRGR